MRAEFAFPEKHISTIGVEDAKVSTDIPNEVDILPSQWVNYAFRIYDPYKIDYVPFPFANREYLKPIYDSNRNRIILISGRQAEKCGHANSKISLANGEVKKLADIKVGDVVLCMTSVFRVVPRRVSRVYENGVNSFIRITTRLGHKLEVTRSHGVRQLYGMTSAGQLKVGDRIASVLHGGLFGDRTISNEILELTAFMIGDGSTVGTFNFTAANKKVLRRFRECLNSIDIFFREYKKKGTIAKSICMNRPKGSLFVEYFRAIDLWGKYSYEKHVPSYVFDLDRMQTSLFLNRLWSTDGHVKKRAHSQYEISYSSTSERLIDEVQSLLWKFGIPSKRTPYKPKGGRLSWKLYIQTQDGLRIFLSDIGALGKSEKVPLPTAWQNNNRYTIPKEIQNYLDSNLIAHLRSADSGHSSGLRNHLKYPPTPKKLERYADLLDRQGSNSQFLRDILSADVTWDTISKIEDIGDLPSYDLEVEDEHNYIMNGVVTHNSTTLSNIAITRCCLHPFLKVLYVAPTDKHVTRFSHDRLDDMLNVSSKLKAFTNKKLAASVTEKGFVNNSRLILRSAYTSAESSRGIPADLLMIDEIASIITDHVPIIEECLSHSAYNLRFFAGTPLVMECAAGHYWSKSTQNEWMVPCYMHIPTHWNVLTEKNIGLKGLICDKCGNPINAWDENSQWASMFKKRDWEGFRVPQLMVPSVNWKEILLKRKDYSPQKFNNEVMANFADLGTRPITKEEIRRCCDADIKSWDDNYLDAVSNLAQYHNTYAGLDYGTGEQGYTVLFLASYMGTQKLKVFYTHRFVGPEAEPVYQLNMIQSILRRFSVKFIGADWGFGFVPNAVLMDAFVPYGVSFFQFFYSTNPKHMIQMSPATNRYTLHRSQVMAQIFSMLKSTNAAATIGLPKWEFFEEPFASDFLNIRSVYDENLRMIKYDHSPNMPDDSFHALVYCLLASFWDRPRPDIIGVHGIPVEP